MKLILGNCVDKLKELTDNSVDSIVTDPPYELGFMGKSWDSTGIANDTNMWAECLRVLKPGGHLLAFSGTRTYHRMASAIEDAGFEVRDMIEWVYGSGFPKSLNIGHKIPEYKGWGTALKPAHEPICMARKPLAEKTVAENCLKWGTGGINIDESRVGTEDINAGWNGLGGGKGEIFGEYKGQDSLKREVSGRFPANLIHDNSEEVRECFPETKGKIGMSQQASTRGLYEGGKSFGDTKINDGVYDSGNASRFFKSIIYQAKASKSERNRGCEGMEEKPIALNTGEAHNVATLGRETKYQNNHPTVKPIALMEYLIKMVTPKGGTVLDPFMGSGSTGVAAIQNGYDFIGIEMSEEYMKIAEARINKN